MPLALYALAAARMFRTVCRLVELHHLPTATVHAWEHSDEGIGRRRAESIAAECDADERFTGCQRRGWTTCSRPASARPAKPVRLPAAVPGRNGGERAAPAVEGWKRGLTHRAFSARVPERGEGAGDRSGPSTAGEWAAPGMHTRWHRAAAPSHPGSTAPRRRRSRRRPPAAAHPAWPAPRSGRGSRAARCGPSTTARCGQLRSIRVRAGSQRRRRWTPSAIAAYFELGVPEPFHSRRRARSGGRFQLARTARSTAARGPVSAPGPELIKRERADLGRSWARVPAPPGRRRNARAGGSSARRAARTPGGRRGRQEACVRDHGHVRGQRGQVVLRRYVGRGRLLVLPAHVDGDDPPYRLGQRAIRAPAGSPPSCRCIPGSAARAAARPHRPRAAPQARRRPHGQSRSLPGALHRAAAASSVCSQAASSPEHPVAQIRPGLASGAGPFVPGRPADAAASLPVIPGCSAAAAASPARHRRLSRRWPVPAASAGSASPGPALTRASRRPGARSPSPRESALRGPVSRPALPRAPRLPRVAARVGGPRAAGPAGLSEVLSASRPVAGHVAPGAACRHCGRMPRAANRCSEVEYVSGVVERGLGPATR